MAINIEQKKIVKSDLVKQLQIAPEITKIIVFGSFLHDDAPNDIDVAIVQNSNLPYLALAMKYRKMTRAVARQLPLDIIPLKMGAKDCTIMDAIAQGEVIYER
ncbi:MAG: nucleotidyltransferase domain-containing protein [Proteobacteria bacterium]|nr:nucleotidyltransferase domain-containing protein [Desulfobulbaceae bacterium]MBU4151329.1 nucleotidyltransferase domain-containing protein [Pseudomonadota bacterium]